MEINALAIYWIGILFFVVALAYSSVGLGGGSTYTASMVILGFGLQSIPMISLTLNLLVTSIGSYHFIRYRHAKWRLIMPFLLSSIPFAYLGGTLQISVDIFKWLLLLSLILVVLRIYLWKEVAFRLPFGNRGKIIFAVSTGAVMGLLAGIVGIGGGIFLVPLILISGLGTAKEAAACGAIFIWLNSMAGLAARLQYNFVDLTPYIPLIIAVVLGGAVGSYLGAAKLSAPVMEKTLGAIVLLAAVLMGKSMLFA